MDLGLGLFFGEITSSNDYKITKFAFEITAIYAPSPMTEQQHFLCFSKL